MSELVDLQLRVPGKLHEQITALGAECGLTGDQMAGAIFVLSQNSMDKEGIISAQAARIDELTAQLARTERTLESEETHL